tara:strand:+ start:3483 stop:6068 length:2586 start_codon:yes stop_codon:yes gene_type:complete
MPILQSGIVKPSSGYTIDQSLRFNDDDSAYLNRTAGTATSNDIGTFSLWTKRGNLGGGNAFFSNHSAQTDRTMFQFDADTIQVFGKISNSINLELITTPVFRDPGAWYHIVVAVDVTQSSASNRVKIYVNGTQITDFGTATYPAQNTDLPLFSKNNMNVGARFSSSLGDYYDGYLAEFHYIDGQQLAPSSFAETNSDTNQWQAVEYEGSYGNNGFYLKFGGEGFLTYDRESEIAVTSNQDWTNSAGAATSVVLDDLVNGVESNDDAGGGWGDSAWAASGSYIRFDFGSAKTYKNAQWKWINSSGTEGTWKWQGSNNASDWTDIGSSFTLSPGSSGVDGTVRSQEFASELGSNTTAYRYYQILGISGNVNTSGRRLAMYFSETVYGLGGDSSGQGNNFTVNNLIWSDQVLDSPSNSFCVLNPIDTNTSGTLSDGNLVTSGNARVTMQPASGQWYYEKDGSGVSVSGAFNPSLTSGTYNFGSSGTGGYSDGNGKGNFDNAVPSGYLAVCSDNLPNPSIADPTDYFNTVLYTGSAGTFSLTGVGFQPDFVWVKQRGGAEKHYLADVVRGSNKGLSSNSTAAETSDAADGHIDSFDSNGWTGEGDKPVTTSSGVTFASWNWKAGGTASSNGNGTITSLVSANTTAGFSVLTYTGTGSNGTVGHGLSSAPSLIITKGRTASGSGFSDDFCVYSEPLGNGSSVFLNTGAAKVDSSMYWNSTSPTSTVFSLANDTTTNESGRSYAAYCFSNIDGYSKVGSYTGNANADGPFVYIGFRPAFVIIKATAGTEEWYMFDNKRNTYNSVNQYLHPNSNSAENGYAQGDSQNIVDFLSNGFKIKHARNALNTSGSDMIYLAFAESPFKYSNAR